jgi:Zn-dependent peptidase ImmA (M78 family)
MTGTSAVGHCATIGNYCPWAHLTAQPDITFGVTRLPAGQGWWLPGERAIVLDDRLDRRGRRSVLAHELAHAEVGDTNCSMEGPDGARLARRREVAADRTAAARLITLPRLADALAWSRAPEEVAAELDVTLPVLRRRLQDLTPLEVAWVDDRIAAIERAA